MIVAEPDKNGFQPIAVLFAISLLLLGIIYSSRAEAATLDIAVSNSTDDAEENANTNPGGMTLTSGDLEIPWDGSKHQQMGVRFQNVDIPAGATITNAFIQFTVARADKGGLVSLKLKGEKAPAPVAFSSAKFNISSRVRTAAAVSWLPPSWTLASAMGVDQRTPNLSSILQEIIQQPGWVSGNPVAIFIEDNGSGSNLLRAAHTFDSLGYAAAPVLHVEYSTGGGGGGGGFQQSGSGLVSMEAEHFQASAVSPDGHAWLSAGAGFGGYSGTDALRALPEDTVSNATNYASLSPRLDYQVNFAVTGAHYVWVRVWAPSSSSNSLHVGLDGQEVESSKNITVPVTGGYVWVGKKANGNRATLSIGAAGLRTVNVWMRESGAVIDKVVLTTDPAFDPSTINAGLGPNESAQGNTTNADLSVTKTVDVSTAMEDGTVIYTVKVTNNGPSDATGVSLSDVLPAGLRYVSNSAAVGTTYDSGTGVWWVGGLNYATTATLHITATVEPGTSGTTLTNTASVSALNQTDPVPGNNSASVGVAVTPSSTPPALAFIGNKTLSASSSLIVPILASNPNTASQTRLTTDSRQTTVDSTLITVDAVNSVSGGTGLSFSATALPSFVSMSDNGDGTGALMLNPGNVDIGSYMVTIRVTDVAVSGLYDEETFTITVSPSVNSSASLSVSMASAPTNVNLAAEGVSDWAAWGNPDVSSFNHKSGVTQQISNFTVVGSGAPLKYLNTNSSYSWSGGTPLVNATNVTRGLRFGKQGSGFELAVPAGTTNRTLKLYVGAKYTKGRLEATLNGSNLPVYVGYVDQPSGKTTAVFTLNYRGSAAGQSLNIRYMLDTAYNSTSSHVSLEGATLQVAAP